MDILGNSYPVVIYGTLEDKYITDRTIKDVILSKQILNQIDLILETIFKNNSSLKDTVRKEMIYSNLPHSKTFDFEECNEYEITSSETYRR